MKVTACVISWNSGDQLDGALDTLATQTHADLSVVVIDNASADGSADRARRHRGVRVLANDQNLGFAGAANQAARLAAEVGSDALCVCNYDIRLEEGYIARAVAALAADPRRASVQGKLWRLDPVPGQARGDPVGVHRSPPVIDTTGHVAFRTRLFRNRGEGQPDDGRYDEPGEVFGTSGAVGLYRLAALDDVAVDGEMFDTDLFAYWEDVDIDWRLRLRGWHAWYAPDARGWHERGGAGPRRSALVERLNYANRLHVVLKNDDLGALTRALPGVAATTLLKTGELVLTVPQAFPGAVGELANLPRTLRKRRRVQAAATVDPAAVVARWFAPFDYASWVRAWWRRVRAERAA
ncbi:glycosyltransferase family 2 protein [soil metagenome]